MKNVSRYYHAFLFSLFSFQVSAQSSDPFEKPTTLANKIAEGLSGELAVAVLTIVIIVVGFLSLRGRIPKEHAIAVAISAVIIGSAAQIANWLIN